ncbi:MAG TPA: ABC transporter substrate-binding protein [Ktedonobacterales bacterium]|jgi:ABC-type nitrate/sulfonate/bicarbonate transport system substrate-binding protein|nr:ABC transporter substrate-binding protein [Ktedonobacterales bacterium]
MMRADETMLRVRTFQGLQNLPVVAAQRRGYFAEVGLAVTLSFTNSSAEQLGMLARGEVELIHTAPDNVVNFETQPAAFGCDPATAPHLALLLGGSNGPLSVFALPSIPTPADLRGREVGVDNPSSGFALTLRDLLAREGLELARDYTFIVAGGTGARAAALAQGHLAATIVYPPFDLLLASKGYHRLATSTNAYTAYASQGLAGARDWVEAHSDSVTRYIAALLRALRWIYTPEQSAAVEALLAAEPALGAAGVSPAQAYAAFTDPRLGFGREAALDTAGLAQVIALRARYGGASAAALGQPADYCDLRWYERARASL